MYDIERNDYRRPPVASRPPSRSALGPGCSARPIQAPGSVDIVTSARPGARIALPWGLATPALRHNMRSQLSSELVRRAW